MMRRFLHLAKIKSLITYCDGKNVWKQIDGGSVNCLNEDDLVIPTKITKDITFDPAISVLGIYPMHGELTSIYVLTWSDLQYILLSEKKQGVKHDMWIYNNA